MRRKFQGKNWLYVNFCSDSRNFQAKILLIRGSLNPVIDAANFRPAATTFPYLSVFGSASIGGPMTVSGVDASIAIGSQSVVGFSVINLHSSGTAFYDAQILVNGGLAGSSGTGAMTVTVGSVTFSGQLISNGAILGVSTIRALAGIAAFGSSPPASKPNITGSRGSGTATVLEELLQAMQSYGLITDSTIT
jgi:hypothetical protein